MLDVYVQAWRDGCADLVDLLTQLDADDWDRPTDLPGWTVLDTAAHCAHLESVLARLEPDPDLGGASGDLSAAYTHAGVEARRGRDPHDVVEELRHAVQTRAPRLDPLPEDPRATADLTPGGMPWTWETLLRNRVVDIWSHDQDIRRAVGRPGDLDTAAAHVTTHTFAAAMPYVLGKRVRPAPGTSVLWTLSGPVTLEVGATIGDDGRAASGPVAEPTTTLAMTSETFAVLAGGRRSPAEIEVHVTGDADLARVILPAMNITP